MRLSLAATVLLLVGCGEAEETASASRQLENSNTCTYRPSGSSWLDPARTYLSRAETGRTDGVEIGDIWGITSDGSSRVFVIDAAFHRVLEFGPDLQLVNRFGRSGSGPGELSYPQPVTFENWLASTDTSVIVMDLRMMSEFSLDGEFLRYVAPGPPFPRRFSAYEGNVLYPVAATDRESGARRLETWRSSADGQRVLIRADAMPALSRNPGSPPPAGFAALQAQPIWAVHAHCLYLSDGAGDWILRVDLRTNLSDTLRLPEREIPPLTAEEEASLRQMGVALEAPGVRSGGRLIQPTARAKWRSITVDPDGYLWLEPWRAPSSVQLPFEAWVVNPANGAVDSARVPAFPRAFVGDGFIAPRYDQTTGVVYLQTFGLE